MAWTRERSGLTTINRIHVAAMAAIIVAADVVEIEFSRPAARLRAKVVRSVENYATTSVDSSERRHFSRTFDLATGVPHWRPAKCPTIRWRVFEMKVVLTGRQESATCVWCERKDRECVKTTFSDGLFQDAPLCWKCLQTSYRVRSGDTKPAEPNQNNRRVRRHHRLVTISNGGPGDAGPPIHANKTA